MLRKKPRYEGRLPPGWKWYEPTEEEKELRAFWERRRPVFIAGIETMDKIDAFLADPDCDPVFRALFEPSP